MSGTRSRSTGLVRRPDVEVYGETVVLPGAAGIVVPTAVSGTGTLVRSCPGRKLGYRFWPGLSRSGPVLVEQSAETLPASDPVDPGRERDHVRFVVGSTQTHPVALVAAPGVVMGDVDVEHMA